MNETRQQRGPRYLIGGPIGPNPVYSALARALDQRATQLTPRELERIVASPAPTHLALLAWLRNGLPDKLARLVSPTMIDQGRTNTRIQVMVRFSRYTRAFTEPMAINVPSAVYDALRRP